MNNSAKITIAILLLIIVGGAYKFVYQGKTIESSDGRTEIILTDSERNLVLTEMRTFLITVQQITQGITDDNMDYVASSAKQVGNAAQAGVPGSLVGKLPLEFKKLGFDTHSKFDQLAMDAEDLGDREHTLTQLSELMQNCISCHTMYRFSISEDEL